MGIETYNFQNIYLITTYRCNWDCDFCLFKYNKEREASDDFIIDRLLYCIDSSPRKVYIKITGGEPFLRSELINKIMKIDNAKIYKVGIGTNGTLPISFGDTNIKTNIFFSKHNIYDLPKLKKINNVDYRLNCNLIKGGVDNVTKIEEYINHWSRCGIKHFCFRELSKVNINKNLIYPPQIYNYLKYYDNNVIFADDIINQLDSRFKQSRIVGNYYDKNVWFWYKDKISVKFRTIDEERLIEYNNKFKGIDEYVIHPSGRVTGCWDRDIKILKGDYYAK